MKPDLRWAVFLSANLLLYFLQREANHHLSPFSFQIHLSGLFLAMAMLRLRLKQSIVNAAVLGFLLDSATPLPFGTTFLLFIGFHFLFHLFRLYVSMEKITNGLLVAFVANILIFGSLALFHSPSGPGVSTYWFRAGFDLFASQVAILCVGPWFFALQEAGLRFLGIEESGEEIEPGLQDS